MSAHDPTYRPIFGVIRPGETLVLPLVPPLPAHHVPVVTAVPVDAVILVEHDANHVTLRNASLRIAPFVVVTVPERAVAVAALPWKAIIQSAAERMKSPEGKAELWQALYTALLEKMRP